MLWTEIRNIDASRRALRSFGLLVGAVFLAIAGVVFWRHNWITGTTEGVLAGIGAVLVLFGWIYPLALRPVYYVWMGLALVLGYVMTRIILTIVFYVVVTPIGLIRRMLGHDSMNRELRPEQATYWLKKTYPDESPNRLEKLY